MKTSLIVHKNPIARSCVALLGHTAAAAAAAEEEEEEDDEDKTPRCKADGARTNIRAMGQLAC